MTVRRLFRWVPAAVAALLVAQVRPATAASDMVVTDCQLIDDCYCRDGNGSIDPGEWVYLHITFTNV